MDLCPPRLSDGARLCAVSFVAARHPAESCGHNGLPLTPNSTSCLGLAARVGALSCAKHPHLAAHLDCRRGKHERVVVVQEHFDKSLRTQVQENPDEITEDFLLRISEETLSALAFLHSEGIPHSTLELENVLLSRSGRAKLSGFGLGFMTGYGAHVDFPIFNPRFAAPEVLAMGPPSAEDSDFPASSLEARGNSDKNGGGGEQWDFLTQIPEAPRPRYDCKSDLWSLGVILSCLALGLPDGPWPALKVGQVVRKVLSLRQGSGDVLERLARDHERIDKLAEVPKKVREVIGECLRPEVEERPSAEELLKSEIFGWKGVDKYDQAVFPSMKLRCRNISWPVKDEEDEEDEEEEENPLETLTAQETYYLWRLAGGDLFGELRKRGLMVTRPPLLSAPALVLGEGHSAGQTRERCSLYDPVVIPLPMEQLEECLREVTVEECYPLLLDGSGGVGDGDVVLEEEEDETAKLPLVIRESDVRYQFRRAVLYRRLLQGYPYLRSRIWRQARTDVSPHYRAWAWAALLGVEGDVAGEYDGIDKETWTPTDRQIEVDIPRCHQVN